MRPVRTIAGAFLRRFGRDRTGMFFAFVLPVMIILVIGLANPSGEITIGMVSSDGGPLAQELRHDLDTEHVRVRDYHDLDALRRAVRRKEVVGGLVVPDAYDEALVGGEGVTLTVVVDPSSSESTTLRTRVSSVAARQSALVQAARFAAAERVGVTFDDALATARSTATTIGETRVVTTTAGDDPFARMTVFDYATVGELVLFLFLTALTSSGDLIDSRRLGVTRRVLASPATARTVIGGEGLGQYLVLALQAAFIVIVGAVVFGVSWGDPIAAGALIAMFCLVSVGAGLLVATIARSNEQATAVGPPIGIALAMLGGCLWPLEIVGPTMQAVGHLTPHAWAVDGFVDLIGRGEGLTGILPQLGVLALFAAGFLTLGVVRLRRAITR